MHYATRRVSRRAMQRMISVIAICAMMLSALAPSISYAFMSAGNADWNNVCRTPASGADSGLDARLINAGKPLPSEKNMHGEYCPFCVTHAGSFGLPPTSAIVLPIVTKQQLLPFLYAFAPRPLFIWAAAQSRAPPVSA